MPRVDHALQAVWTSADRSPAAIGLRYHQTAVKSKRQSIDAAFETLPKQKHRPLHSSSDLFEIGPHEKRVSQLANDALPGERPELAVGHVPHRLADRFTHRVRKPQG